MFVGKVEDKDFQKSCPVAIQHMLKILNDNSIQVQENGKYMLDEGMFYVLMDYDTESVPKLETHQKYIDVQVILKGRESMGWALLDRDSSIQIPYNEEKDLTYYQMPVIYNLLACPTGICTVFFPNDIHAPGLIYHLDHVGSESVRKVVGKIPVSLVV